LLNILILTLDAYNSKASSPANSSFLFPTATDPVFVGLLLADGSQLAQHILLQAEIR
jgi:hypothetical protein